MNLLAANKLLQLYKSITIETLEKTYETLCDNKGEPWNALTYITGFGDNTSCKLCKEAKKIANSYDPSIFCKHCIYKDNHFDDFYCIDDTYTAIINAESLEDLYTAIQNRIVYLEQCIKNITDEI